MITNFSIPIHDVHAIEITSRCNLRCSYCPSPKMGKVPGFRAQLDMTDDIFDAALDWVRFFVRHGTQGELNLAGIGESTMHPRFVDYVRKARATMGASGRLCMATNGLLMTEKLAQELKPLNLRLWVSLHVQQKAKPAVEILRRHGLLEGISTDPTTNSNDWAGQVESEDSGFRIPCPWMRGWAFIMADGNVASCCLDATGQTVLGHVKTSSPQAFRNQTSKLCRKCWQTLDYIPDFDQANAGRPGDDDRVHLPLVSQ